MKAKAHVRAYVNHSALNLGAALECLIHMIIPPQIDHSPTTVRALSKSNPIREFFNGLGLTRKKRD